MPAQCAEGRSDPLERFEQGEIDIDPDDDKLAAQLGSIKWGIDSRGRIKLESKDHMRALNRAETERCLKWLEDRDSRSW